jgi:tRNA (guanine37-N1)-methyltransferase
MLIYLILYYEMTKKETLGISVRLKDAETVRHYLNKQGLLRKDLQVIKEEEYLYFPVLEIPKGLRNCKQVMRAFEERKQKPQSYKELVSLPEPLHGILPTSYDIVGDIILIKLAEDLRPYRHVIGEALLRTHRNVHVVCRVNPVSGELRTRDVEVIAGEHRTVTTHTEYGLSLSVDIQATYFSSRLSSERKRIADLVQPEETIVDMFAGVAPFSIMIARYAAPRIVYAIDKNKEAVKFAEHNVRQNHVLDKVEVIKADASQVATIVPQKADRIIMNLPFTAHRFFSTALSIANATCMIHYYDILNEDAIPERICDLNTIASSQGFNLSNHMVHRIKSYTPREFYIGIDITARKRADVA